MKFIHHLFECFERNRCYRCRKYLMSVLKESDVIDVESICLPLNAAHINRINPLSLNKLINKHSFLQCCSNAKHDIFSTSVEFSKFTVLTRL